MHLKSRPQQCLRCGRPFDEGDDGWNVETRQGRGYGAVCPDCQTPEEIAEAAVKAAALDYGNAAVGSDGRLRVPPLGGWHIVRDARHPLVDDDPANHLLVTSAQGRLLIAVAAHSDAGIENVFASGTCTTVARAALKHAGARAQNRPISVAPLDLPNDSVVVTEDVLGGLVMGFSTEMNPQLLNAFAPWVVAAMRTQMNTPTSGRGPSALEGIVQSPLPPARPERRPAPEPDNGLVSGSPAWQRFWCGHDDDEAAAAALEEFRARVVNDSGAARILAQEHGVIWSDLPEEQKRQMHVPGPAPADAGLDIAALMLRTRTKDWTWDGTYARVSPHRLTEDLTDLHPTDISALRWGLVAPKAFTPDRRLSPESRSSHAIAAVTTTAAYLAEPYSYFLPAAVALDVATTAVLSDKALADLRLASPWAMVLHEPVPLAAIQADDHDLKAMEERGQMPTTGHAILGGVLAAHPDHTIDTTLGLVLTTSVHPRRGRQWYLRPAHYGTHGAGRLLYAYLAQLSFATWHKPPQPPEQERGKPGSTNALKRLAKHPAARAGGLHRMNILDIAPPLEAPQAHAGQPPTAADPGRDFGTWRRPHWAENRRIGIRDANGELVGPVYKDGAVEGVTFTRGRVFIHRSRIRPDLPLRPDTRTLYRQRDADRAPGGPETSPS